MVSKEVEEYILLRDRLSLVFKEVHRLTTEKATLEGQVKELETSLKEADLPSLKTLLDDDFRYKALERRLIKPVRKLDTSADLPWLT